MSDICRKAQCSATAVMRVWNADGSKHTLCCAADLVEAAAKLGPSAEAEPHGVQRSHTRTGLPILVHGQDQCVRCGGTGVWYSGTENGKPVGAGNCYWCLGNGKQSTGGYH